LDPQPDRDEGGPPVPVMSLQDCLWAETCFSGDATFACCAGAAELAGGAAPDRVMVQHPPDMVLPSACNRCCVVTPLSTFTVIVSPEQLQLPPGVHIGQVTWVLPFGEITAG